MNHTAFSRKGGRARSLAKTTANRAKAVAFWNAVRAGQRQAPRRLRVPPPPETIANLLAAYCRQAGITRLEIFGSMARGKTRRGSDVDLLATFADNPGLRFFTMEDEMAAILGMPVHLLTRDAVEQMTNPYRRDSILADAKVIYLRA
jgi:predicted nucleotidyltransferase